MSMPFFLPFPLPGDEASLRQAMARPGGLAQVPTGELAHIGRAVAGLDLLTLVRLAEEATQGDGPLLYEFWLGVHGGEPSACAAWFNLGVARMKAGEPWQVTIGADIEGQTLGILGLGKLGKRVAGVGKAFGMRCIAWSQNLTPETCESVGVEYVTKDELFKQADFLTIHTQLSDRTRGLIGARELGLMKKTAYLVNTSRGPIVDEKALLEALQKKQIAGAGLDVFEVEPLPLDHPFRQMDNVVITPHLGYVSRENFEAFYQNCLEAVKAWAAGAPIRVLNAA